MPTKKSVKKDKPYSLRIDEGIVAEVSKGCYLGVDDDGEFTLVDDICDAYIGVEGELEDSVENYWIDEGKNRGYPKFYKVRKELKVLGCI